MTSIVDLVEISTFSFFVSEHPKPKEVTGKTKFVFIGLGEPASLSTCKSVYDYGPVLTTLCNREVDLSHLTYRMRGVGQSPNSTIESLDPRYESGRGAIVSLAERRITHF